MIRGVIEGGSYVYEGEPVTVVDVVKQVGGLYPTRIVVEFDDGSRETIDSKRFEKTAEPVQESYTFDKFMDDVLLKESKNVKVDAVSDTPQRKYIKKYRERSINRIKWSK